MQLNSDNKPVVSAHPQSSCSFKSSCAEHRCLLTTVVTLSLCMDAPVVARTGMSSVSEDSDSLIPQPVKK